MNQIKINQSNEVNWYWDEKHHGHYVYMIGCVEGVNQNRMVSFEEAKTQCADYNIEYFEVNLTTGFNLRATLESIHAKL